MKIVLALAALALPTASFAGTPFTGPRVELTAGVSDVTHAPKASDITYGAAGGFDLPVGKHFRAGAEVTANNVFNSNRVYGADVRAGVVLGNRALVYGLAGYENYRLFGNGLSGVRVGGGVEASILPNLYAKAEYRYTDLDKSVGRHSGVVGLGFRF